MKKLLAFLFPKTIREIQCDAVEDSDEKTEIVVTVNHDPLRILSVANWKAENALNGVPVSPLRLDFMSNPGQFWMLVEEWRKGGAL